MFEVAFELYGRFKCLHVLHSDFNYIYLTKYGFIQRILKLLGIFEIHWVKQNLVNCTGLVGIVNVTRHKTEPFFTDLVYIELS